jgi:hypothetical protein
LDPDWTQILRWSDDVCPPVLKITYCVLIRLQIFYSIPSFNDFPEICSDAFHCILTRFERGTITFLSRKIHVAGKPGSLILGLMLR